MTALQLNAELFRSMSEIADDENLMNKLLKYVKKLAATKRPDPTLMTKEELNAMIEQAEEDYRQGRTHRINSIEELNCFLNNL